jgi:hypothetical protein
MRRRARCKKDSPSILKKNLLHKICVRGDLFDMYNSFSCFQRKARACPGTLYLLYKESADRTACSCCIRAKERG